MHSPFDKKPHYLQGILTVTPDGKAPSQPLTFSAGSSYELRDAADALATVVSGRADGAVALTL